jgi:hypothetical protein
MSDKSKFYYLFTNEDLSGDTRIHNENEIPENTSTLHKNTNN